MSRFILVLGLLLLPKAETLKCYECTPDSSGTCTEKTTQCPSQKNQCLTARTMSFAGGSKIADIKAKGCGMTEECAEGSINFGISKTVIQSKCCTTDLCNTQTPEYKSIPNGKKCFSCVGQDCTRTLNCEGNENHCVTTTVDLGGGNQKVTLKGCASQMICSDQVSSVMQQFSGAKLDCCQGNYCNGASSASPAMLLLLVPLFFSVLF